MADAALRGCQLGAAPGTEQEVAILAYVEKHHEHKYAIAFRFLLGTGLRLGELGQLARAMTARRMG